MRKKVLLVGLVLILVFTMATNAFASVMITIDLDQTVDVNSPHVEEITSIRAYTTAVAWVHNNTNVTQQAALRVYEEQYVKGQGFVPVLVSETIVEIAPNSQTYLSQFGNHFHNQSHAWMVLVSTGSVTFDGYFKYSDPNQ